MTIPPTLPEVTSSNWKTLNAQGWRFKISLPREPQHREKMIKSLQQEFGVSRVTIGHPWSFDQLAPYASSEDAAAYVKDVDSLVEKLYADIDQFEEEGGFFDN